MQKADLIRQIELKFAALNPVFDERVRRQWAAAEAIVYGWGGVTAVSHATGLSIDTLRKGIAELSLREIEPDAPVGARVRGPGGGRQRLDERDPDLVPALERLVDPATRGDPRSPLRWTCKGTRRLAEEMTQAGHPISAGTVAALLKKQGYSLQGNRKTKEGTQHPDRGVVRAHQYDRQAVWAAGAAGDLGGRQEEGTGGTVQEWRSRMAAQGQTGRSGNP